MSPAFDLATGSAAVVGDCLADTAGTGLAVDLQGNAFIKAEDQLYSVDRATGDCTFLTAISGIGGGSNMLEFDPDGRLFSGRRFGGVFTLYEIDPVAGTATPLGSNDLEFLAGLAFRPPPIAPLYAVDGDGGAATTLYRLDPRDGSVLQTIGATGQTGIRALAFDPASLTLYAAKDDGGANQQLLTIDPHTAFTQIVGPIGLDVPAMDFSGGDGVLYAWAEPANQLQRVDPATDTPALVGGSCASAAQGFAIDLFERAFLKSGEDLLEVDLASGACGPALPTTAAPGTLDDLLDANERGTLFTGSRITAAGELFTLDPQTGDVLAVGTTGLGNLSSIEFVPVKILPEPSLTLQGAAGLVALALAARRRRTRRTSTDAGEEDAASPAEGEKRGPSPGRAPPAWSARAQ